MCALPDWCEPLFDAEQMRAIDRWAIEEQGVPSLELMERAGTAVAVEVERVVSDGPVAVVCGKGNNGGDGLVVARLLRERGREVRVICACDPAELSGDVLANLRRLPGEPPPAFAVAAQTLAGAAAIVDALLGTGFQGRPRGVVAEAIEAINAAGVPVVSVDVPSGVDASSGEVAAAAVRAAATVTFHAAKPGLWVAPGKRHVGRASIADIGIPRGAPVQASVGLICDAVLRDLAKRTPASTKFTSGHVAVAGGSRGLMGAPAMSALAAMRAGAGYVTACVPQSQAHVIDVQLLEAMTCPLEDARGSLSADCLSTALDAVAKADALVLGPGLGREREAFAVARELAARARLPTLIDADGLNAHAGHLAELAAREAATVLTPHAGELARLLGLDSEDVQSRRLHHVREAARISGAAVVLKGDDTLIASPDGRVVVSQGDAPALATAGSGDVLSGVIAALLAQRVDAFGAAAAGVLLHVRAGQHAARRLGAAECVIASDVIAALPAARSARL